MHQTMKRTTVAALVLLAAAAAWILLGRRRRQWWRDTQFPIDVVITWVDGTAESWKPLFEQTCRSQAKTSSTEYETSDVRYKAGGNHVPPDRVDFELEYNLRCLQTFAPFVRRIHVVLSDAYDRLPPCFSRGDVDMSNVRVVRHSEFMHPASCKLPTFNSNAIESQIHKIPGLAEHFVYLNDDMYIADHATPGIFFTDEGKPIFHAQHAWEGREHGGTGHFAELMRNTRLAFQEPDLQFNHLGIPMTKTIMQRYESIIADTCQSQCRKTSDVVVFAGCMTKALQTGDAVKRYDRSVRAQYRAGTPPKKGSRFHLLCINDNANLQETDRYFRWLLQAPMSPRAWFRSWMP
jgi:hypothetical protein